MARLGSRRKKRSLFPFFLILTLLLAAGGGYVFLNYFEGVKPVIDADHINTFIGKKTPLSISFSDRKSGLRSVRISLSQGQVEKQIFAKEFPKTKRDIAAEHRKETVNIEIDIKALGLKDGEALLTIEAVDYSMRRFMKGNINQQTHKVTIDTKAPKISIIHSERYIQPGGTGIVIYKIDDSVKRGVIINNAYHPGFPLVDESEKKYISYFAMPFDAVKLDKAIIKAEDVAGNVTEKPFAPIVKKPRQKHDTINVSEGFLSKKIPEFESYYPEMSGTIVEKYLYANSKIRMMNNKKIHDLCMQPDSKRHWSGRFIRMAGSGRAGFADHRTYYYNGKAIDKQVHLGMDIASTRHANVKAAGTGKVVYSDYLGIYGNMIMLDHGQGVFSLYSHLSQSNVSPGDMVSQGDVLGNTGTSGMAGGDHLHFSMLVNGIFVTPREWWDQHWIDVTIDSPVMDAKF
jgi:murein DD-endopeptidase MepM/ murein hydrolase activator NlpD